MDRKAKIFTVNIDCIAIEHVITNIQQALRSDRRMLITHTNITGLNIAYDQKWYSNFLNNSDLVYCDGVGVQWGARILGQPVPPRFTLADWVEDLASMCAANGFSLFFLGNPPGVAQKAADLLVAQFSDLHIAGTRHGYFNKAPGQAENQAVIAAINSASPHILLVGFGMPLQEKWLEENWDQLNVRIAITCGGLFEIMSGSLRRGPRWMTDHGLEWLSRVIISPRRSAKRYARDVPLFFYRVILQRLFSNAG